MKNQLLVVTILTSLAAPLAAHADETALTIYSKAQPGAVDANSYRPIEGQGAYQGQAVPGYAMVRQLREIELPQKSNIVKFTDVAALIDPTTVQFKSLTDPKGTKVGEQDFQFDLVSQQKLMEKYIDKTITVEKPSGDKIELVQGTLMSTQGGITLKTAEGNIRALNNYSGVSFPELPGGLITRPTLVWSIFTGTPGKHKSEVSYQTDGITWWADYNFIYKEGKDANSGTVDVGSWVSIINQTGASFANAKLKLMAGDVQRAAPARPVMAKRMYAMEADAAVGSAPPAFAEKSFFEYHLYTLDQPVNLPNNSTKQIELIPAAVNVPVEKELVFNGSASHYWAPGSVYTDKNFGTGDKGKVDVVLKLANKKEGGLGVPLPAGRVRVSQRDDDGSLEFVGENVIDHTPRNEELSIKLGEAFDVVGERKQISYTLNSQAKTADEEIEVRIRNQKKQAAKVKVVENLYRATGWQITESSGKYSKDNAHQISFIADLAPEKEAVIRYRVRYSW